MPSALRSTRGTVGSRVLGVGSTCSDGRSRPCRAAYASAMATKSAYVRVGSGHDRVGVVVECCEIVLDAEQAPEKDGSIGAQAPQVEIVSASVRR